MKKYIWSRPIVALRLLFTLLCLTCYIVNVNAAEYGEKKSTMPYRYQVKTGKNVKVRSLPNTSTGKQLYTISHPDCIYVDDSNTWDGSGYAWVSISGNQGYVAVDFLDKIDNPYYSTGQESTPSSINMKKTHEITKWVLLVLIVIGLIGGLRSKGFKKLYKNFLGIYNSNGMRKLFFFNPQPYSGVVKITLYTLGVVVSSVLTLLAVGLIVYLLFWLIKILLIIIVWVGIIGCIIGIIGCVLQIWACIVLVIIGGIIWHFSDNINTFGQALVDSGFAFFNELNMFSFTLDIFSSYWKEGLAIALTPMAIFLILAIVSLLFAGTMKFIEWMVTKRYNIKHPCPICQHASEPAVYVSQGSPLPVNLQPGMFGLFSIKHPETNEKMPTMLFNGRDKLSRRCKNCDNLINAKVGEEKHIAIVGVPEAGKSTLIYRMIAEIIRRYNSQKVSFTDTTDPQIKDYINYIVSTGRMNDYPAKTSENRRHRSIQLLIQRSGGILPYRLFVNDVSGEMFISRTSDLNKIPFFNHVQSIVFVIDPYNTYFGECSVSSKFEEWYNRNIGEVKDNSKSVLNLNETFDIVKTALEQKKNKPKHVHFNFVFVKKDRGYLKGINAESESELKEFLAHDLDMEGLIYNAEHTYASVHYYAVSAIKSIEESNVGILYNSLFNQINLKM